MYTYHRLINKYKRRSSIIRVLEDMLVFLLPIIWAWCVDAENFNFDWSQSKTYLVVGSALIYVGYLSFRIFTVYKISSDKRDAYRKQFLEQLDSVVMDKYKMLCNEIHYANHQDNDVLLYDAHGVIRNILNHIKQLISNITDVSLNNISVNFIYKYHGENEHWQTIDGSSSCSIGELDDIVEKKESMYHHLYANNREYIYYNDKASADWHVYMPSIRDGEEKLTWGSIYCKRILCTLHQDRFVDGILAISSYNEKFTSSNFKSEICQIENLINEAVSVFESQIKCEMASLYIRHEYIKEKQIKAIDDLIVSGIIEQYDEYGEKRNPRKMTEKERVSLLDLMLPIFKAKCNTLYNDFFVYDSILDYKTEAALKHYAAEQKAKPNNS